MNSKFIKRWKKNLIKRQIKFRTFIWRHGWFVVFGCLFRFVRRSIELLCWRLRILERCPLVVWAREIAYSCRTPAVWILAGESSIGSALWSNFDVHLRCFCCLAKIPYRRECDFASIGRRPVRSLLFRWFFPAKLNIKHSIILTFHNKRS